MGSTRASKASSQEYSSSGSAKMSSASSPRMASSAMTVSRTERAMGPRTDRTPVVGPLGSASGTRPWVALKPDRPQSAAGMRIDPPPSDPVARGTSPAARAAAEPPEDPPGE